MTNEPQYVVSHYNSLKKISIVDLTQMRMPNSSVEQRKQRKKLNIEANGIMAMVFLGAIEIDASFD